MDLESRVRILENDVKFLREADEINHRMITTAIEQINLLHVRIDNILKDGSESFNELSTKTYMMFYKMFPEALEADDALDRAMKAQKKKPKE